MLSHFRSICAIAQLSLLSEVEVEKTKLQTGFQLTLPFSLCFDKLCFGVSLNPQLTVHNSIKKWMIPVSPNECTHYKHYCQLVFLGHRSMRKYALHNWCKILCLVLITQQCHTFFKVSYGVK